MILFNCPNCNRPFVCDCDEQTPKFTPPELPKSDLPFHISDGCEKKEADKFEDSTGYWMEVYS